MISLANVASAAAASSYYAADNYYTSDQSAEASQWLGEGAEALGMAGFVDAAVFEKVLAGELPDGSALTAQRGDRRPGLDITFSVSKSLSLVAMLGGDVRIIDALKNAVQSTLSWTEKNIAETRIWDVGHGAQKVEKSGNLVAATFLHNVNRNHEPQLHIHAVIVNATKGMDGKWHAIHNDQIYQNQHVIGAVFNAELRHHIEQLGYATTPAKNPIDGEFEIVGVTREQIEAFSSRSMEIREALDAAGRTGTPREKELAALATRSAKSPELDPAARMQNWQQTADRVGLNLTPVIADALALSARQMTIWDKLIQGLRTATEKGLAIAAKMGLTPRDGDTLVPERRGRLEPKAFATAQAVASAARDLSEREAAFKPNDLIRTTLERGGPVRVEDVEARIALLRERELLVGGEQLMTREVDLQLERQMIDTAAEGKGAANAIAAEDGLVARIQASARDLGLRRLNDGQLGAALKVLVSEDRVVAVQGGAGVGKSAALVPVAQIAKEEGRAVYALSMVGRTAAEFGGKLGLKGMTVDGFLAKYAQALDGAASPERMTTARSGLAGSVVLVDEASLVGNEKMARLIGLANQMGVGRLVLAGDTKQLLAIEAGKPYAQLRAHGVDTAHVQENLRAGSPQMKTLVAALETGDIDRAFTALKSDTVEIPFSKAPETAARLWVGQPEDERNNTLLLAAGRQTRTLANAAVQCARLDHGELGQGMQINVLDRVNATREGARQMRAWQAGNVAIFRTNLPSQNIGSGERYTVLESDGKTVQLLSSDGEITSFDPSRMPKNLKADAVSLYKNKTIAIYEHDRIRWTESDKERGLLNGELADVKRIDENGVTLSQKDGRDLHLARDDKMLERLDLAYAINVHLAQGMTAQKGIIVMGAQEGKLNNTRAFLVAVTRIVDHATLVVDNATAVARAVARNPGDKNAAQDAVKALMTPEVNSLDKEKRLDLSL